MTTLRSKRVGAFTRTDHPRSPKRRVFIGLLAVLFLAQVAPVSAHQDFFSNMTVQPAVRGQHGHNHELPSVQIVLPPHLHGRPFSIDSSSLSADQLDQILNSGHRTFLITSGTPIAGDVVIPKGVTLVYSVNQGSNVLSIQGNLTDAGRLFLVPVNGSSQSATLNANNVSVSAGGLLSSVTSHTPHISLTINALANIVNAGTILAGCDLTLSASGTVTNALPAGAHARAPVIQAQNNINTVTGAGAITNAGVITALGGNFNIAAAGASQSINVTNTTGTIYAANAINLRDPSYTGSGNINISGGNLLSQEVNLYSGKGTVNTNVDHISGVVNVTACNAHIGARTPDLKLGTLNVSGDPTYFNTGGDVTLNSGVTSSGAALAILASGNISISGGDVNTTGAGAGGDLLMVAGATISASPPASGQHGPDPTTQVTISPGSGSGGGSTTGGSISIANKIITTGAAGGNGGNVQLIAYSGSSAGSGNVTVSQGILTGGNGTTGNNGTVTVIAGATTGNAISVNSIDTTGNSSTTTSTGTGAVVLSAAAPTITGGNISVTNGVPTGGSFIPGTFQPSTVTTGGAIHSNAAGVQLASGGDITLGDSINTASVSGNFNQGGGPIALVSGGNLNSPNAISLVTDAGGLTAAGANGTITLVAGANLQPGTTATQVKVLGASTGGGSINFQQVSLSAQGECCAGIQSGGNASLLAFHGGQVGSGQVNVLSIDTHSPSNGPSSGKITVIAGGSGTAITTGALTTEFGNRFSGSITITAADPTVTPVSGVVFDNGLISSGSFGASTTLIGSISIGQVSSCGGAITVKSGGDITLTGFSQPTDSFHGSVNNNAVAPGFQAQIVLQAANGNLNVQGDAHHGIYATPTTASSPGGIITITAQNIVVGGTGPFQINANATNNPSFLGPFSGNGGTVSITQSGTAGLTIGTQATGNNIQISVASGTTGNGSGGTVILSSGGNLVVDPSAISAAPTPGGNGNGAQYSFTAGTPGPGNLQIGGSLSANGVGSGQGGSISLTSNSSSAFVIGGSSGNFVNGTLAANGGPTSGGGGGITIINKGSGGLPAVNTFWNSLSVVAQGNGNGGSIDIESPSATLTFGSGSLSVLPAGSGTGGSIILSAQTLAFPNGGLTVTAGGTLIIENTGAVNANLNKGNTFSGKDVALIAPNSGFTLGDSVTGTNSIALITKNSITSFSGFSATSTMILAATGAGSNIGTSNNTPLSIDAANVTAQAANGSVWITDTTGPGNVNLVNSTVQSINYSNKAGATFSFNAPNIGTGNNITTLSGVQITAADIALTSSGGFSLGDSVTGTSSIFLQSGDSITSTSITSLSTPFLTLQAFGISGPNIGTNATSGRLVIDVPSISASATGSVWIKDTSTGDVNGDVHLFNCSSGQTFSFSASGIAPGRNVIVQNGISISSNHDLDLTSSGGFSLSGTISASNAAALISNDSITSLGPVFAAATLIVAATGTASNIGADSTSGRLIISHVSVNNVTAQANGSVWITDTVPGPANGNVNLVNSTVNGANYTNTATNTFSFKASGILPGKNLVTQAGVQISATDVVLTSSGGFSLGDSVTGTNSVALISHDSITSINGVSAPTLVLVATGNGSTLGTDSTTRLSVNAQNLTAKAAGSLFITDTSSGDLNGNVNLVNSTVDGTNYSNTAGNTFSVIASGIASGKSVTTQSGVQISGANIDLTSSGGFSLGDSVTGTNFVAIISNDAITSVNGISAPTVLLAATGASANIGTNSSTRLMINASSVTVSAGGSAWVTDTSTGDVNGNVNFVNSTVNGTPYTNGAPLVFSFNASNIAPGKNIITQSGVDLSGAIVNLFSSGGISLGGNVTAGATVALISHDSITSISGITASQLALVTTGTGSDIGTNATAGRLVINVPSVTVNAQGSAWITDTSTGDGSGNVKLRDSFVEGVPYHNSAGNTLSFNANGILPGKNIVIVNPITAADIALTSSGGVSLGNAVTGTNSVALITNDSITSVANISAPQLILVATGSGSNIGTNGTSGRLPVNARTITASANQSVWITDTSTGDVSGNVNLVNSIVDGTNYSNTAGANFSFNASSIASGKNVVSPLGANVSANDVDLTSSGGFSLGGSVTGTNSAALISHDAIVSAGAISAPTVVLVTTGPGANIGTSALNPISINASILAADASGSAWLVDTASGTVTLNNVTINSNTYTNAADANSGTYSLTTSNASISIGGVASLAGNTVILKSNDGGVTVTGGNITAHNITINAATNMTVLDATLAANADGVTGDGGSLTISAVSIVRGVSPSAISLSADGTGTGNGGSISVTLINSLTAGPSDNNITVSANAGSGGGGTGNGGIISVSITGANNSLTVNPGSLSASTGQAGGNGAQVTLSAAGNLSLQTSALTFNGSGSGRGGHINLSGDTISWSGAPLALSANGSGTGDGGLISMVSSNFASSLQVGTGFITMSATSGAGGGNGGIVSVTSGGMLSFDSSGVTADPQLSGNGAHVTMIAAGTLTVHNGSYSYNGSGANGAGGLIDFEGGDISAGSPLGLSANGTGTGNGGTVKFLITNNPTNLTIDSGSLVVSATGGSANSSGGDGGKVTVSTGGSLTVNPAALTAGPLGSNGSGAIVSLTGSTITKSGGGTFSFNASGGGASGSGSGDGGSITLTETTTLAQTVSSTGTFSLQANAGTAGGSGGSVSITTGGNLTVNPNGISVQAFSPGAQVANGGSITLVAGNAGPGTLQVLGSLSANAVGANPSSTGGSITLQSNSITPFSIDSSKAVNGTQGILTATGGNTDGTISVANIGGAATDLQPGLTAQVIDFITGTNGSITVSNTLGGPKAGTVNLSANGTGKISAAKTIQAGTINATSGTGAISLTNVSVSSATNISALTSGTGTVTITGTIVSPATPNTLNITGASGAAIKVATPGDLTTSGAITGTAITLTVASKSGTPTMTIGGPINASAGLVTLSAPGDITNTAAIFGFTGIKETASAVGSTIMVSGNMSTDSSGTTKLTAANGSIDSTGADISGGKSISLSSTAGNVSVGSIGANSAPAAITLKASNISSTEDIRASNSFKATASSSTVGSGNINLAGTVDITSSSGIVSLSSSGNVSVGQDLSAGKSVSAKAKAGTVSLDSVGIIDKPLTVSLSGVSVSVSGSLSAANSAVIKATGTVASTGNITLGGDIAITGPTGKLTVTSGALGTITDAAASTTITASTVTLTGTSGITMDSDITAVGAINMSSKSGSISTGTSAGITSSSSSVALTALNNIDDLGSISAGTTASVKTTLASGSNHLTFGSITTTNGAITVIGAGGSVSLTGGSTVNAHSLSAATITIEDSNTTSGSITIHGGGTTIATNGAMTGNINVCIGKPVAVASPPFPAGVNYEVNGSPATPTAPPFFFGSQSSNVSMGANPGNVTLNSVNGGRISFNAGARTVTVDSSSGTVTITGDPPAPLGSIGRMAGGSQLNAPAPAPTGTTLNAPAGIGGTSTLSTAGHSGAATLSSPSTNNDAFNLVSQEPVSRARLSAPSSTVPSDLSPMQLAGAARPSLLSDLANTDELNMNEILAEVASELDLGIKGPLNSGITDLEEDSEHQANVRHLVAGTLRGQVNSGVRALGLHKGNVLLAPTRDTEVRTTFGNVDVAAGSLALVMLSDRGLSVYDLDDIHRAALVVRAGGGAIPLIPGTHATITTAFTESFELVNPAHGFGYRDLHEQNMGCSMKAYLSEFSIASAIHAVRQIRQLLNSVSPQARKLSQHLMKTAAIVIQIKGGAPFQQMVMPPTTAMR